MKILMLTWEYPPRVVGGIARVVHDLSHRLIKDGHEVTVVTYREGETPYFEDDKGVKVYRVDNYMINPNNFIDWIMQMNFNMVTKVNQIIAEQGGFDVIHAQGDPEVCMRSFIKYYKTGENISELQKIIDGGFIISNGKKILTNKGKYIHPDNWGVSRKEQIPVKEYDDIKKKERYVLNISRGCPYGCPHCLIQLTEGRKERRRSIENLKDAIEYIKNDYSVSILISKGIYLFVQQIDKCQ